MLNAGTARSRPQGLCGWKCTEWQLRLYRWIATDRRWNRKALSRLSSVIRVMRLPSSPRNSMPSLFMAPMVCAAIGMNEYDCVNGAYLVIFLFAAASAAAPGVCDDIGRYDRTTVPSCRWLQWHPTWRIYRSSMVLTSHYRVSYRQFCFLTAGISAFERARQTRSFMLWCRANRPYCSAPSRWQFMQTFCIDRHWCGSQMLAPSRRPTAICTARSSSSSSSLLLFFNPR